MCSFIHSESVLLSLSTAWRKAELTLRPAHHRQVQSRMAPVELLARIFVVLAIVMALGFISLPASARAFAVPASTPSAPVNYSVVVYGSSSAAVTAAVASARNNVTTVLVSSFPHLGGMTSSGLGKTDTGDTATIGGLANAFYRQVGAHYNATAPVFNFEPHVAERVFNDMVASQPYLQLLTGYVLDSVTLSNDTLRILSIDVASTGSMPSLTLSADVFIDASYEGDLLRALPPFTYGREARSQYNESLAGVTADVFPSSHAGNQLDVPVDPWVLPNNTRSGLLPLIDGLWWQDDITVGEADDLVQSINYRLCLTTIRSNAVPFTAPSGYDPSLYELYRRYILAANLSSIEPMFNIGELPHDKYDFNNAGGVSTDVFFTNSARDYILAPPLSNRRTDLINIYRWFTRGLLHFLSNSTALPDSITTDMSRYGLCADEFVDNEHWPYQLYIREGLRLADPMRLMTQHEVDGEVAVDDGIALGSYNMDSHNVRRVAVWEPDNNRWVTKNEGDVQVKPAAGAYRVPYSSMVRRVGGVGGVNLLVPVCIGGTHMAVSSVRMEPVYMMLGRGSRRGGRDGRTTSHHQHHCADGGQTRAERQTGEARSDTRPAHFDNRRSASDCA